MEHLTVNKKEMLAQLRKVKYVYGSVIINEDASKYYPMLKKYVEADVKREYDETTWNIRIEGISVKVMFIG